MNYLISGQTPSSKNSKVWTGKRLINNKRVQDWYDDFKLQMEQYKTEWNKELSELKYPINLHIKFVRKDNRIFDYINPAQTLQDALVKFGYLPDDNYKYVKPIFEDVEIDKNNPCVIFWIE